jgi:glycosyltransferase involved in cell wall biosynthesis
MDPNFIPAAQSQFDRDEFAIASRARIVFASARTLFDRMQTVNDQTYLLPNAAPSSRAVDQVGHLPDALSQVAGPIVGYLGTVDWRFDPAPIAEAARALPHVTFAIVGRVNPDQEHRLALLHSMANVMFLGQVSASAGQACLQAFDLAVIPFLPGPTSDAINPVKMWTYLAAGLPVVSTWIAECRDVPGVVATRDGSEFTNAISDGLAGNSGSTADERRSYAERNTWDQRAAYALEVLRSHNLL